MTTQEVVEYARRPLSVVAVALNDLHRRGVVRRRIIEGNVYWSIDFERSPSAHH